MPLSPDMEKLLVKLSLAKSGETRDRKEKRFYELLGPEKALQVHHYLLYYTDVREKMKEKVAQIKRDFNAITREELLHAIRNRTSTLEQFMIGEDDENYYCDVEELQKILPLKEMSKEDYFVQALSHRYPEFANKLTKEHKMLAKSMELV